MFDLIALEIAALQASGFDCLAWATVAGQRSGDDLA